MTSTKKLATIEKESNGEKRQMTKRIERATVEMKATKLRKMATTYGVTLVGDVRRSEVKRQWVELINDAIVAKTGSLPDNVIPIHGKPQEYFQLDDLRLEGYVSFNGYAVHSADYSRYEYPENYEFQKPVYRFIKDHGYRELKRGFNLLLIELRKNAQADLQY